MIEHLNFDRQSPDILTLVMPNKPKNITTEEMLKALDFVK